MENNLSSIGVIILLSVELNKVVLISSAIIVTRLTVMYLNVAYFIVVSAGPSSHPEPSLLSPHNPLKVTRSFTTG